MPDRYFDAVTEIQEEIDRDIISAILYAREAMESTTSTDPVPIPKSAWERIAEDDLFED